MSVEDDNALVLGPNGVNEIYRDSILEASHRTGMSPEAIASVIHAEAATTQEGEFKGRWIPESASPTSDAQGLTQFLTSTWLDWANRPGTALNDYITSHGLTVDNDRQEIADLRTKNPGLAIVSGAEYDSAGLVYLQQHNPDNAALQNPTDTQKAKYLYLCHHEGWGGANEIINGSMDPDQARAELLANAPSKADSSNPVETYTAWINEYIDEHIIPDDYRATPSTTQPSGFRIKGGDSSVVLGVCQWPAAHVSCPHDNGGQIAQGSSTVLVGKDQQPFARKGDATTDGAIVWGNTRPDILIGG